MVPLSCLGAIEASLGSAVQEVPVCWQESVRPVVVTRKVPGGMGNEQAWNDNRYISVTPIWHAIHERSSGKLMKAIAEAESEVVPSD